MKSLRLLPNELKKKKQTTPWLLASSVVDHVLLVSPVPGGAGVDGPALDHGMVHMCMQSTCHLVTSSTQASGFLLAALVFIADAPLPAQRSAVSHVYHC